MLLRHLGDSRAVTWGFHRVPGAILGVPRILSTDLTSIIQSFVGFACFGEFRSVTGGRVS